MQTTVHESSDYRKVVARLTEREGVRFTEYIEVTSVLARFWSEFLTISEFAALTFILGRTLMFRKRAERISRQHFENGVVDSEGNRVCAGVGFSYNTLRTALDGLESKGLIEVHAFVQGRTEVIPRVYEVKTDKIVAGRDLSGVKNWTKNGEKAEEKQQIKQGKSGVQGSSKICDTLYQNLPHLKDILRISNNHKESSSEDYRKPAVPAKKEATMSNTSSANGCTKARQLAEQILAKSKERRQTRASVTTVPTKKWNTTTLQALLDTAREKVGGAAPRIVVTAKGVGVLHQRMLAAGVEDVVDCFAWMIANWATVSSAQRRSVARQENKRTSEMHQAPNFQDLCYRFPYLYKFYQDRKFVETEKQAAQQEQRAAQERTNQSLEQGRQARREAAKVNDLKKSRERARQDEEFENRRRARYRNPPQERDDDLPEYEAPVWGAQK